MFPLSLLLRPEVWQMLKNVFQIGDGKTKEGMPHVPGEAVSIFTQSKEEFIQTMSMGGQNGSDIFDKVINKSSSNKSKDVDEYSALMPAQPRKLGDTK